MEDIQFCPGCGAANPARRPVCKQCGRLLHQEVRAEAESAAPSFSAFAATDAVVSDPPPQTFTYVRPARFQERPQVKIVRPSNRRKFLAGVLGGAAIIAIGSTGIGPLVQNLRLAFNTKDYPYHFGDDFSPDGFSPDLNLMAMTRLGEDDSPDARLYIWDYQQQHMTSLPTGPNYGDPACIWSPDSNYFLYQARTLGDNTALDMWDMRTQQKVCSYSGEDYGGFSKIHWSPDGSQVAWLLSDDNTFVVMHSEQLVPRLTFKAPAYTGEFAWSPDGRKVAFLVDNSKAGSWSVQLWDLQTRSMYGNVVFQDQPMLSQDALNWSPDSRYIAAFARGQARVIQLTDIITTYKLNAAKSSVKFAWSPDGEHLVVSTWMYDDNFFTSAKNTLDVWDVAQRRIARSYDRSTTSDLQALAWSRDGKRIVIIATLYRQENWDWA